MNKTRTTFTLRNLIQGILTPLVFWMAALSSLDAQTTYGFNGAAIPGEVTASLTDQQDNYIVRFSLPGRDLRTVTMSLDGNRLHVEAPSDGKFGRYEQDLVLEGAVSDKNLRIDRREAEKTIVLVVPKGTPSPQQPSQLIGQNAGSAQIDPFDGMTRVMVQQLQQMQKQMEQMMGGTFPEAENLFGSGPDSFGGSGLSDLNFEEQKDKYIVRAKLSNPRLGKINVGIKEEVLTIEAKEENAQQGNANTYFSRESEFSQSMRLPGPVEIGKMKVDRSADTLIITLPKASS